MGLWGNELRLNSGRKGEVEGGGSGYFVSKMGARNGAFWAVLGGAFCATIRKVLLGRGL